MNNIPKKKIIIIAVLGSLLIITSLLAVLLNKEGLPSSTGGSGKLEKGTLILQGYESPVVNSRAKTPIGKYLSTSQQSDIHNFLEAVLYNEKPLQEYRGKIIPESTTIDYRTNIVQFKAEIEDPKKTYTIYYLITGTDMHVFDDQGKELKPPGA